jgi:AI-2 transport protein TqsA
MSESSSSSSLQNLAHLIIIVYFVFYLLSIGQQFIVPFLLALFLTSFIVGIAHFYNGHIRNQLISYFLSISSIVVLLYFVGQIFSANYAQLVEVAPIYQEKITSSIAGLNAQYQILEKINIKTILGYVNFPTLIQFFGNIITSFLANASVVFLYTLFLLLEYRYFTKKMKILAARSRHEDAILQTIHQIREDIASYFFFESMIAFTTASISYIVMLITGLDFALFWAFLIFVLDFIPNIGSFIAMLFPIVFGFIQFDTLSFAMVNMIGIIVIQILMSNIIEPKIMGNKLNLSALVIMLSLGFWAILWGGIGMILAMPIMVSLNIIFSKFEATQ